jgi:hypothetical protein
MVEAALISDHASVVAGVACSRTIQPVPRRRSRQTRWSTDHERALAERRDRGTFLGETQRLIGLSEMVVLSAGQSDEGR